jgi:hypothetical protein
LILAQHQLSAPNRPDKRSAGSQTRWFWFHSFARSRKAPLSQSPSHHKSGNGIHRSGNDTYNAVWGRLISRLLAKQDGKLRGLLLLLQSSCSVRLSTQQSRRKLQRWVNNRKVRVVETREVRTFNRSCHSSKVLASNVESSVKKCLIGHQNVQSLPNILGSSLGFFVF